jgi:hypothetical protein
MCLRVQRVLARVRLLAAQGRKEGRGWAELQLSDRLLMNVNNDSLT